MPTPTYNAVIALNKTKTAFSYRLLTIQSNLLPRSAVYPAVFTCRVCLSTPGCFHGMAFFFIYFVSFFCFVPFASSRPDPDLGRLVPNIRRLSVRSILLCWHMVSSLFCWPFAVFFSFPRENSALANYHLYPRFRRCPIQRFSLFPFSQVSSLQSPVPCL